jgi:hypothetical protein
MRSKTAETGRRLGEDWEMIGIEVLKRIENQ